MDTNFNSSIAFQSNIKMVSPSFFKYKLCQAEKIPMCENISHWDILPRRNNKKYFGYRENLHIGFTTGVRSCTAGLFVKKNADAPLFIHLENTLDNYKNTHVLEKKLIGSNAILVGSKKEYTLSKQLFNRLKVLVQKKKIPLTILQGLSKTWQADLLYEAKGDTLFLCVNDIRKPRRYVNNEKKLQDIFEIIKVSKKDNIEYYTKIQEWGIRIKNYLVECKRHLF